MIVVISGRFYYWFAHSSTDSLRIFPCHLSWNFVTYLCRDFLAHWLGYFLVCSDRVPSTDSSGDISTHIPSLTLRNMICINQLNIIHTLLQC